MSRASVAEVQGFKMLTIKCFNHHRFEKNVKPISLAAYVNVSGEGPQKGFTPERFCVAFSVSYVKS